MDPVADESPDHANTPNNRPRVERTNCQNDCQRLTNQLTDSAKTLEHALHGLMVANAEKATLSNDLEAAIRRASEIEQANVSGAPGSTGHTHAPGDGPFTRDEMEDLIKEMDEAGKIMAKYQEAIRALEKQVDRLTAANPRANEAEIVRLNIEIAEFTRQLDHCKESKKDLTDQVEKLSKDIAQHKASHVQACKDCQKENDDLKKSHKLELTMIIIELGIKAYMGNPYQAIVAAIAEFRKASADNSVLRDQATQDAATITKLRSEIRAHEVESLDEGTELRSQAAKYKAENTRLRTLITTLQAQSSQQPSVAVDDRVTAPKTETTNLKKEITDLKKQVADLKTDKADCATDKDHYEHRIKVLITRVGELEEEKAEADSASATRQKSPGAKYEAQIAFSEARIQTLKSRLATRKRTIEDLQAQLDAKSVDARDTELDKPVAQLDEAGNRIVDLEKKLAKCNAELAAKKIDVSTNTKSGVLYAQTQQLQAQIDSLTAELNSSKTAATGQIAALTTQNTTLKTQVTPYTAAIARIGRITGRAVQDIDLANEIDRLNRAIDARDVTNAHLSEQNNGLYQAAALNQQALADANAQRIAAEQALDAAGVSVPSGAAGVVIPREPRNNAEIQAMRDQLDAANRNVAQLRQQLIDSVVAQPSVSNPSIGDRPPAPVAPKGPPKKKRKGNGGSRQVTQLAAEARAFVDGNMWKHDPIAGPFRR